MTKQVSKDKNINFMNIVKQYIKRFKDYTSTIEYKIQLEEEMIREHKENIRSLKSQIKKRIAK